MKKAILIKQDEVLSNFNNTGNEKNLCLKDIENNMKSPKNTMELRDINSRFSSNENQNKEKSISIKAILSPNLINANTIESNHQEKAINIDTHKNDNSQIQNIYTKVDKSSRDMTIKGFDSPSKIIKINDECSKIKTNFISKIQSINKKLLQYKNAILDPKNKITNSRYNQISLNALF